jgi:hypothetical protein
MGKHSSKPSCLCSKSSCLQCQQALFTLVWCILVSYPFIHPCCCITSYHEQELQMLPTQHLCPSSALTNLSNTQAYQRHFQLRSLKLFLANQTQLLGLMSSFPLTGFTTRVQRYLLPCYKIFRFYCLLLPIMRYSFLLLDLVSSNRSKDAFFFLPMQILNHL